MAQHGEDVGLRWLSTNLQAQLTALTSTAKEDEEQSICSPHKMFN